MSKNSNAAGGGSGGSGGGGGLRWAEMRDDELLAFKGENRLDLRTETKPDEHGIRTVQYFKENDAKQVIKVTEKVQSGIRKFRINKTVEERRRFLKGFGVDRSNDTDGPATLRPDQPLSIDFPKENLLAQFVQETADDDEWYGYEYQREGVWQFRGDNAKGDDVVLKDEIDRPGRRLVAAADPSGSGGIDGIGGGGGGGGARVDDGKYVAPGRRGGDMSSMQRDDCTVRVSNLSEDVTEGDLEELFGCIGKIGRTYLAKAKESGQSRGYAFVTFSRHEEAARAIQLLNKHGYDHLILQVEWAKPSQGRLDQARRA